jgi:tellurite resistance protein TehA-like permease
MTGLPIDRIEGDRAAGARPPTSAEAMPEGRVASWVATMDPGYFAAVMATGIVGISARLLGHALVADVLLWVTVAFFVVLLIAYIARAALFRARFTASLRNPSSAVAYFTVVAGTNVLAVALTARGLWMVAFGLGVAASALWLLLTYGLLCSIVLAGNRPVLREINGLWLIWVVGTQSVSVIATGLAPQLPWPEVSRAIGATGLLVWGVGVVLYLVLVVIIFLRLLLIETTPAELGPAYWILMGATAISVRAAAGILALGPVGPTSLLASMRSFIVGLSVVLWSFGSWFIPMLVLFGVWRYVVRRYPWTYEPKLWSVVFPLGMYAVASVTLGREARFDFMPMLASVWVWVGVAGWCVVALLMLMALLAALRRRPAHSDRDGGGGRGDGSSAAADVQRGAAGA